MGAPPPHMMQQQPPPAMKSPAEMLDEKVRVRMMLGALGQLVRGAAAARMARRGSALAAAVVAPCRGECVCVCTTRRSGGGMVDACSSHGWG